MTESTFGVADTVDEFEGVEAYDGSIDSDETSPFDELLAESKKEIAKVVTFSVDARPGWLVRFDAVIDDDDLKRYRKHAQGKKKRPEDADLLVGNSVMLAEKSVAILKETADGRQVIVTDPEEGDMRLNSRSFIKAFSDDGTVISAHRKFLGDAGIHKIGGALLREAGYEDDLQPVDPTNG